MIDFLNETDNVEAEGVLGELSLIQKSVVKKESELIFIDDIMMRKINKKNRNIDKPTDVLSFPIDMPGSQVVGTIVISLDTAQRSADEFGHTLKDEIKLLFIHGLLHLLGFDHETDDGEMREKEEELIKKFDLPTSLIVRSQ